VAGRTSNPERNPEGLLFFGIFGGLRAIGSEIPVKKVKTYINVSERSGSWHAFSFPPSEKKRIEKETY
jgi:hypothetical protein